MKTIILLVLHFFVAAISGKSFAQYYFYNDKYYDRNLIFETGFSAGAMNSRTDVGTSASPFKTFTFSSGFYVDAIYQDVVGVRLEATWGSVRSADSLDKNNGGSKLRNLNFKTDIQEVALLAEFYPLMIKYYPDGPPRLSPYITAGVGWFSFNPQAYYNGRWFNLPPLHTEGEGFAEYPDRKPYRLSQINFPVGGGLKYELSSLFTLRGELLYRYLKTDYLDDVSTKFIDPSLFDKYLTPANATLANILYSRRGEVDPGYITKPGGGRGSRKHNDGYYNINIKLAINLGRTRR